MLLNFYLILISFICVDSFENLSNSSHFRDRRSLPQKSCGISPKNKGLLIGGRKFNKGDYPWMVALMLRTKSPPEFFCGGVIISNRKILTAAHCIYPKNEKRKLPREILILLGVYDLDDSYEFGRQVMSPKEIFIHPNWNPYVTTFDGDIAAMEFEKDFEFNEFIQPVCLWKNEEDPSEKSGTVIGYGYSGDSSKRHESIPRELDLPIIENDKCIFKVPNFASISSPRTFCAGSADGTGPCLGDSGNGLLINHKGVYYLRGIVSSSLVDRGVCDVTKFAVYTDATKYKGWIADPSDDHDPDRTKKTTTKATTRRFTETTTVRATTTSPRPSPDKQTVNYNPLLFPRFTNIHNCGIMSVETGLVVGGIKSTQKQFPWTVSVHRFNGKFELAGTGALISKRAVISPAAGISIYDSNSKLVTMTVDRIKLFFATTVHDSTDETNAFWRQPNRVIAHPNFRQTPLEDLKNYFSNNMAILTIETEIYFSDAIRPVCVWPYDYSQHVGWSAYGVGYGRDETGQDSGVKKHARLTFVDSSDCSQQYRDNIDALKLTKYFCLKGSDSGTTCSNDFPLYTKYDGVWYFRGWFTGSKAEKSGVCIKSSLILYEDITEYSQWIQSILINYNAY